MIYEFVKTDLSFSKLALRRWRTISREDVRASPLQRDRRHQVSHWHIVQATILSRLASSSMKLRLCITSVRFTFQWRAVLHDAVRPKHRGARCELTRDDAITFFTTSFLNVTRLSSNGVATILEIGVGPTYPIEKLSRAPCT